MKTAVAIVAAVVFHAACASVAQQRELESARARVAELERAIADRPSTAPDDRVCEHELANARARVTEVDVERASAEARIRGLEERLEAAQQAARLAEANAGACEAKAALQCVPEGDAKTAASCAASVVCEEQGRCGHVRDFGCVPTRDAHCRRSKFCRLLGACFKSVGAYTCTALKEDDCRASLGCKVNGACTLGDGVCK